MPTEQGDTKTKRKEELFWFLVRYERPGGETCKQMLHLTLFFWVFILPTYLVERMFI
jgi:hypothetical protein